MSHATIETPKKLCKDCRHFRPLYASFLFFKFSGPAHLSRCAAFPSPVSGEPDKFCDIERNTGYSKCGPEGKLWCPSKT